MNRLIISLRIFLLCSTLQNSWDISYLNCSVKILTVIIIYQFNEQNDNNSKYIHMIGKCFYILCNYKLKLSQDKPDTCLLSVM